MVLPPPLPRESVWSLIRAPFLACVGLVVASGLARAVSAGSLPGMVCLWRRWTGVPCPGCGGTRCLAALSRGELVEGLGWNPLVTLVGLGLLGWLVVSSCDALLATRLGPRLGGWWPRGRGRVISGVLIVLNCLYLWCFLP